MPALSFAATLVFFLPTAVAGPPDVSARASSVAPPAAADAAVMDVAAASHSARTDALMGSNCSYTTGMMARRVLEEGEDWSFAGALTSTPNEMGTMVAAPFVVDRGYHVIANELIEVLNQDGNIGARLFLEGKLLEVDGVRYVVLTSYRVINS